MIRSTFKNQGLELSVAQTGEGRAFIIQHGLCGAAGQPAEVFPAGIGWQCLTLECRGHGQSPAGGIEKLSIETFADDVAAFMSARQLAPAVVGGISMGAAIALRLAVIRPELVSGLVLARPAWSDAAGPSNLMPNAEVGDLLRDHSPAEARRRFERSETFRRLAIEAPDNLASLLGFFERQPIAVTQALLSRISRDGPGVSRDDIRKLSMPTLVIGHDRDAIHPLSMAEDLAALIPAAKLAVITPKADDVSAYRTDFRSALTAFLNEVSQ